MAALIPNIAKGKFARYVDLPAASDKLVWVIFTGTETDDNIRDADTLTAVIATALNEATFTGYSRQDATSPTTTPDDTNNWLLADVANPTWSPTSAEAITRIGLFYDPDSSNTATTMVPIFIDDFAFTTPTSGSIVYDLAATGFGKAA